jgi:hypothetical protein
MTLATVAAGILIMLTVTHQPSRQLPQIAESPSADDRWLEETLLLLEELDEDVADETVGGALEEEWLEELQLLDDMELTARS